MITSPAQYENARHRIRRFNETLIDLERSEPTWLRDLQVRDIHDQIASLENDLAQYNELASGEFEEIVVERLADFPKALIQGRIAAGLSPDDLARAAGQSPLKIQQWERDGYSRAPIDVMRRIAEVLPLRLEGWAVAGSPPRPPLQRILTRAGLPREVFKDVILPSKFEGIARDDEIDRRLQRLFGSGAMAFAERGGFGPVPLRFKLPANAPQDRTRAYASYVDGVCRIVASVQPRQTAELPQSWRDMRRLIFPDNTIDFRTAVRQCWVLGIGVIGLRDKVAFHGAARRLQGKSTIVLKSSSRHQYRWLFSLLHEVFHLVEEPEDFTLIESNETSKERRESRSELRANRFAALILTNGNLESILNSVISRVEGNLGRQSNGNVNRLVAAVRDASIAYDVPVGIVANLVADNVQSSSRINWWGAAQNLQPTLDDPWKIVRDIFIDEVDLTSLDSTELSILRQILETRDE